jgi:hypothetical protein
MRCERGQATLEWTAVVLLVALVLGAAITVAPVIDGRSFGAWLGQRILCALRGEGCPASSDALGAAYAASDAELLRRFAPNIVYEPGTHTLPVDFRRCASHTCSDAPDDPSLDTSRSNDGTPAAVFTHVVHRGGETFLQYWFYYPDSTTTWGGAAAVWRNSPLALAGEYPGFHEVDWEGFQVRLGPDHEPLVRATSHHGYQGCKEVQCENRWILWTGWTRVSRGSHAGHIPYETKWDVAPHRRRRGPPDRRVAGYQPLYPGRDLHERTTSAGGLQLIPIESLPADALAVDFGEVTPPWEKEVYRDPLSNSTS